MDATNGPEDKPHPPQFPAWCRANADGTVPDNAFAESLGNFFERLKQFGYLIAQADQMDADEACTLGMWLADMAKEGDAYTELWHAGKRPPLRSVGDRS